ncbi:MAG: hypothetical protein GXO07_02915 [Crenarchaeota archaeon]|nr:hypothetical protein [Thermoproteota archaeon]
MNEEKLKFIREEFMSKALFEFLYESASKLFGEAAARQLVYKIMKDSAKMAVREAEGLIKELADPSRPCDSFKLIYKMFGIENVECSAGEGEVRLVIRSCPLPDKYDRARTGRACVVMIAIVAGMVEELMKKRVYVETPRVRFGHKDPDIAVKMKKSIVLGDGECAFEAVLVR